VRECELGRCIAKFHAVKLRLQWSQTLVESVCVHGRPRGVQFTPTSIIHHRRRRCCCCCCRWPLSDYGDAVIVRVHCAVRRRPALQCAYKARLSWPLHLPRAGAHHHATASSTAITVVSRRVHSATINRSLLLGNAQEAIGIVGYSTAALSFQSALATVHCMVTTNWR